MNDIIDIMMRIMFVFLVGAFIMCGLFLGVTIYDGIYIQPIAADKANMECKMQGFDFYESFDRIGIFSKTPVAIKCKYVEQYRKIDLNQPLIQIGGK